MTSFGNNNNYVGNPPSPDLAAYHGNENAGIRQHSPDLANTQTPVFATVRRPNPVFNDNVAVELLSNLSDALHAAWNGWETACKYEDEDRQDYYMKVIRLCDDTMKKIKKF